MTNLFLSQDGGLGSVRQGTGEVGATVMCGRGELPPPLLRLA